MEKNERLQYLLNRYVSKAYSAAEEAELMEVIASGKYDDFINEYLRDAWSRLPQQHRLSDVSADRIAQTILSVNRNSPVRIRRIWMAAAAVVLIACSVWVLLRLQHTAGSEVKGNAAARFAQDVAPGSDGAVLTLADGTTIQLDSAGNGQLASQGNMSLVKQNGRIQYLAKDGKAAATGFNTMGTARGKQFQLTLEDGTKVWLNAASSIRFPVVFPDSAREVEVSGEAFFDVARNSRKPFRVKTGNTSVEVLGTQFNINAYADEAAIKTTLIDGAVRVKNTAGQSLLAPGQQARTVANASIKTISNVNTGEVLAWKNNYFSFDNTEIKTLMRQLARWYNVEVVFKGNINSSVTFNGDISRTENLSKVLSMLELTGEVTFAIQGKNVIVNM